MKKIFVLCLALLLVLPLFAGCTKKKTTDTPSPDSPAPQSSATESFSHCSELPPDPADGKMTLSREGKTLTVKIPYAVLDPIHIPADQIKFRDVKKGWAAPKDIKLTAEENAQLMIQVNNQMKAKLIDENIIAVANESAKIVVADLLSATVHSIDPEFTVVVVQ